MSMTELVAALSERGVTCERRSKRHVRYSSRGTRWSVFERHDGSLSVRSDTGMDADGIVRMTTAGTVSVSGDGVVGHAECSRCGGKISPYDSYCRHCGTEIVGGWGR